MRTPVTTALWTVFTLVAVASGLGAVTMVRNALTTPAAAPLTQAEVVVALGSASPPGSARTRPPGASATPSAAPPSPARTHLSAAPSASPGSNSSTSTVNPTPSSTGQLSSGGTGSTAVTRTLGSRGGTVRATCTGTTVYLQSWSPTAGYRAEEVQRGPASTASVKFEGPTEVQVTVGCVAGVPTARTTTDSGRTSEAPADS